MSIDYEKLKEAHELARKKEAFKDKETVTPAEKWQALFKKMDEMKNE